MKKFTVLLLVVATALCCLLGLAACGDKDEKPSADFTVTESEWEEAVSLKWKNLTFTVDTRANNADEDPVFWLTLQTLENGSIHQTTDGTGWGELFYIVNEDNTVSSYNHHYSGESDQEETVWYYDPDEYTDFGAYVSGRYSDDVGYLDYAIPLYAAYSSSYTYDESKHCYTGTKLIENAFGPIPTECKIEISFEDKKLTKIVVSGQIQGITKVLIVTLYDYGTTVITTPEHAFDVDELKYDNTEHWNPCIAEGCQDKSGAEQHTYHDGKCECGAEQAAA